MFSRYVLNLLLLLLPPTRCFAVKRTLAKWAGIEVEDGVSINGHTCFFGEGHVAIGRDTWIGLKNTFYRVKGASIKIGKNCGIGPEVAFIAGSHVIGGESRRAGDGIAKDIVIEDGCWIGARVTILGGVTISKGAIVAAGAVVCTDVSENSLYAGVPAVLKRSIKEL